MMESDECLSAKNPLFLLAFVKFVFLDKMKMNFMESYVNKILMHA